VFIASISINVIITIIIGYFLFLNAIKDLVNIKQQARASKPCQINNNIKHNKLNKSMINKHKKEEMSKAYF
jgi:hypothetical protein